MLVARINHHNIPILYKGTQRYESFQAFLQVWFCNWLIKAKCAFFSLFIFPLSENFSRWKVYWFSVIFTVMSQHHSMWQQNIERVMQADSRLTLALWSGYHLQCVTWLTTTLWRAVCYFTNSSWIKSNYEQRKLELDYTEVFLFIMWYVLDVTDILNLYCTIYVTRSG